MRTILQTITLLLCLTCFTRVIAEAQDWGPWESPRNGTLQDSSSSSMMQFSIRIFQRYISPVDGQRCAMYPTCSAYALQALEKHGPFIGSFIFVDRLYHEGDPIEHERMISKYGYLRYADPLENNDFWLAREKH